MGRQPRASGSIFTVFTPIKPGQGKEGNSHIAVLASHLNHGTSTTLLRDLLHPDEKGQRDRETNRRYRKRVALRNGTAKAQSAGGDDYEEVSEVKRGKRKAVESEGGEDEDDNEGVRVPAIELPTGEQHGQVPPPPLRTNPRTPKLIGVLFGNNRFPSRREGF